MSNHIRVLLVDDHPVVRQGLATMLIPRNGMEVIGEAKNGREAVALAGQLQPDVIIMDLVMPGLGGVEATTQIKAANPQARVLILTSFGEADKLLEAINAGAAGCLLKDSAPDELLHAIRGVHRGQMIIPQDLAAKLVSRSPAAPAGASPLTEREQEVAALIAQGLSNKAIAGALGVSSNTVRSHISNILRKLNLSNRTQIAIYLKDSGEPAA